MRSRRLRALALVSAAFIALLWLAPALLARSFAASAVGMAGGTLELDGVRPLWPFGVSAERAVLARGDSRLELRALEARLSAAGPRIEAGVGAGALALGFDAANLRSGYVRARALPLKSFAGLFPAAFAIRGAADGVYRFGARESIEGTLADGEIQLRAPVALALPFAQIVLAAQREADGSWRVNFADMRGPPVTGTAVGTIGALGALSLRVAVSQLEEPALGAFAAAGLPTGPLPYAARLGGSLVRPTFEQIPAGEP